MTFVRILLIVLVVGVVAFPVKAQTILEVNRTTGANNGVSPFKTIQAAVNAAGPNTIIEITDSGTYEEDILITGSGKSGLTLRAAAGMSPTIEALDRAILAMNAANVTIDGVNVESPFEAVVFQGNSDGGTIKNMTITSVQEGIEVEHGASNSTVDNVTFFKNSPAVKLEGPSSGHVVKNSRFYDTNQAVFIGQSDRVESTLIENNLIIWGIRNEHFLIQEGTDITIRNNIIYQGELQGIHVKQRSENIVIDHNTIIQTLTSNPKEKIVNLDSNGIDGTGEAIIFEGTSSGSITNNIIVANGQNAAIGKTSADTLTEDSNIIFNSGSETVVTAFTSYGPNTIVTNPLFEKEPVLSPTLWRDIPEPSPPYVVDFSSTAAGPKLDFVPCDFDISAASPASQSASDLTDRGAIQFWHCSPSQRRSQADLALTKVTFPDVAGIGDDLVYSVTVTNNGPEDATDLILFDFLPDNITIDSITVSQGNCTGTSTITCLIGDVANTDTASYSITVIPIITATLVNTVSITGTIKDPILENNSVSWETSVTTEPNPDPDTDTHTVIYLPLIFR